MGVAVPVVRRRLRLGPIPVGAAAAAAPFGLAVAVPRTRGRDVAVCALQMWAFLVVHEMPYDDPEELERRVHVRYPVVADRVLGLGELPGLRLQRALARSGQTTRLDAVLIWTHWMWFAVPHGSLAYVLAFRRERFPAAAASMYAVFDVGALAYWAVPTAPPWYAALHGVIAADTGMRRLMVEHGQAVWRDRWESLYSFLGGNPLAAMPSLHFATSVMAALLLSDLGPVPGAVGWTYAVTLGFALVYLGEHYVVDLLAGLGLTLAVRRAQRSLAPVAARLGAAVGALEARDRA